MGWLFGDRNRTYVGTAVNRLIEDNLLPNIQKTAPIEAILTNSSVSDTVIDNIISGIGFKSERAFKYAANGKYYLGLPQSSFMTDRLGFSETKLTIEDTLGIPIEIQYHRFSSFHFIHYAFKELIENYGYDERTNIINGIGSNVYLENIIGAIDTRVDPFEDPSENTGDEFVDPDASELYIWELGPNKRTVPWRTDEDFSPNWAFNDRDSFVRIYHGTGPSEGAKGYFDIPVKQAGIDESKGYIQTKYHYNLNKTFPDIGYFTYEYGSGTYPLLDSIFNVSSKESPEYFPVVFFRHDRQDVTREDLRDSYNYKSSNKLMKILGLDYQQISNDIQDAEINPEIDKVEEALMTFSIPMNTELEEGQKYLYEFFNHVIENDTTRPLVINTPENNIITAVANEPADRSIRIADDNFKYQLNYGGLSSTIFESGGIGAKDSITVNLFRVVIPYQVYFLGPSGGRIDRHVDKEELIYRINKQLGNGRYHEIVIGGLAGVYDIGGKQVWVDPNNEDSRILIPVNRRIVKDKFNTFERDKLYAQSLHLVFNSSVTKKIPWYQTSVFKGLLAIVAIVVTIVSAGYAAPAVKAAYLGFAATYGVVAAVIITALKYIAISVVFNEGFKFAAAELGAEVATVLATLAAAVGVYGMQNNYSWGANLVKVSSGLANGASNEIKINLEELSVEMEEFTKDSKSKLEELEVANAELNGDNLLDVNTIFPVIPIFIPGETPQQFYDRTLGSSSITDISYEFIHKFTDMKLRLPTISETLEEFNNVR